jgi:thioesterase domain-containing protein
MLDSEPPGGVPASNPAYVVTIIPGTFAGRAKWALSGSAFCRALEGQLAEPVAFEPFMWGFLNNSRTARHRAATQLSSHVEAVRRKYPAAHYFLIAHSHGGNVALEALTQLQQSEAIGG